jgi:hypothetical protein
MMWDHLAHLETRQNRLLVCFAVEPGIAVDVVPGDRRVVIQTVRGYGVNLNDASCRFWKELPTLGTDSRAVMQQLQNWKPEEVRTPWDDKHSETKGSILHVLTVGVSEYAGSGFPPLPYAVPSARAIEDFFREQQASSKKPYATVWVRDGLYDQDATRDKLRQRLSEMAEEVGENDVVLLYLAGHGRVAVGEEMFYFVPADGREADLRDTAINTAMIAEALRNLRARRIVLIVDACQSGGAIEALSKVGAVKAQVEERRIQRKNNVSGDDRGVGIHLIAATLPLSYAVGLPAGESVLAETLMKALRQQAVTITVHELSTYIGKQLPTLSEQATRGFRQVPLLDSIGLDFPIAAN